MAHEKVSQRLYYRCLFRRFQQFLLWIWTEKQSFLLLLLLRISSAYLLMTSKCFFLKATCRWVTSERTTSGFMLSFFTPLFLLNRFEICFLWTVFYGRKRERGEEKQQENHLTCKRCFADNHLGFVEFVFWVLIWLNLRLLSSCFICCSFLANKRSYDTFSGYARSKYWLSNSCVR